jgi:hypothetical protein
MGKDLNGFVGDCAFVACLGETDPRGREAVGETVIEALAGAGYTIVQVWPHEAVKGLKPLVVYFGSKEDREEFISAIHEAKPNVRTIKV